MPRKRSSADLEFDVGARLRIARHRRGITLAELARRCGVSESFLSQVERGRTSASISSLRSIASALGLTMSDLFDPVGPGNPRVLRRDDRPMLSFGVFGRKQLLTSKMLQWIEAFVVQMDVGGSTGEEAYTHGDSEELILVLAGRIELQLGDASFILTEGDSIVFRSSVPHRVQNVGSVPAEALWVISPPSY